MLFYLTDVYDGSSDLDALRPIYGWSPDPIDCARCGEATTCWWRDDSPADGPPTDDDEAVVCPSCKTW